MMHHPLIRRIPRFRFWIFRFGVETWVECADCDFRQHTMGDGDVLLAVLQHQRETWEASK